MTYQLNKPITWKEFKKMPIHIQKEYLDNIIRTYHVNASDLAVMFGTTYKTVSRFCAKDGINIKFRQGTKTPAEQKKLFEEFISGCAETKPECDTDKCDSEVKAEDSEMPVSQQASTHSVFKMNEISMLFSGKLCPDIIYNSIASVIPKGSDIEVEIRCKIL